ncbi:MAG TPA: NAD(P)/FAD-dependent oxidoreductase [Candidatus Aminicenantes bacterium]|nr:NAD(P)/FAD-dependent oxidoreductase [Candidatus Aminicenantes bacterium]HRY65561.1 NAD(P)/FAD-dependent oxidoreductase [Candidatus Aminicenantes bacterium]HRZ72551.1 NAD(P)/FAD-dependent oxidoreductase [Candidatus Aminicenantes bacterium]
MAGSIIVIGAGVGGLAAGIYGRMNGFDTKIFEMNAVPGGQCCAWKRGGYTFDGCIHHLFGCAPGSRLYGLWQELGAMPRAMVQPEECTSVLAPDGRLFRDYYDLDRLRAHMTELAPGDAAAIDEYVRGCRAFVGADRLGEMMLGTGAGRARALVGMAARLKWLTPTMEKFGRRFKDLFLKRAVPQLVYSNPAAPLFVHLVRHGYGAAGSLQWPSGGTLPFALSIARRYKELGGEIAYSSRVERILTENGRAVGVRLADGGEHRADVVISDADGRKTIMDMLEGRFVDDGVRRACGEPPETTAWSVHVYLGVKRDLTGEPSAMIMLLDEPVEIAGHRCETLEMQIYGFDRTMAPAGKSVIKAELFSDYSYWKRLAGDRARYEEEKARAADRTIDVLERRWPGLRAQVETIDVPTQLTWERYMGGTHGFANMPAKKASLWSGLKGAGGDMTLPGLDRFYFVGVWASMSGSLFGNALSGRRAIQELCRRLKRPFIIT